MSFEVEIELSKKNFYDYYNFDFLANIKKESVSFIFLFLLLIGVIYFIVIGGVFFAFLFLLPILGIIIGFFLRGIRQYKDANILIENGLNKCKYTFNENNFTVETRVEKQEYNTSAILNVAENKNYLFLFEYQRVAWILPKNQLNENQYKDIIKFLNNNSIIIKKYSWC